MTNPPFQTPTISASKSNRASPTLSVVLPNFNHASLIPRAVEALLAQELPADEIIIIDDASTDDSLAVITSIAQRAENVRVVSNPCNLGVVATLQRGIDMARGKYIYLAAADDWVLPGFFSLALPLLEAHPRLGLFCGDAVLVDGLTEKRQGYRPIARPAYRPAEILPDQARALLDRIDNWLLTGSIIFNREILVESGGLDVRLGAFADSFLSRKIALVHGFYYAPRTVAVWCVFASSVSRVTALERAEESSQVMTSALALDPAFPEWYAERFRRRWRFATSRLALEKTPADMELVKSMGSRTGLDRAIIRLASAVLPRRMGHVVILAWLWVRLRPTSLVSVMATALQRRAERGHLPLPSGERGKSRT